MDMMPPRKPPRAAGFCVSRIRRRVFHENPKDQIFTTRDCLTMGTRAAVDKALSRMVKAGIILRLARGVFVGARAGLSHEDFSPRQIATIKAQSFGKQILERAKDIGVRMGVIPGATEGIGYAINASASRFWFGDQLIEFESISQKELALGDSKAGNVARVLIYAGKRPIRVNMRLCFSNFYRADREQLLNSFRWMPHWLTDDLIS